MSPSTSNRTNTKVDEQENHLPLFDRSLPMMLKRARESVMSRFMPALKAHDLSAEQWRAMRVLDQNNGMNISELSKRCYVLKPSMTRIIQNLENRGIIERRSLGTDQRLISIFLTDTGRNLINLIAPTSEARYHQITEKFGDKKLNELTGLLDELMVALNELDEEEAISKSAPKR